VGYLKPQPFVSLVPTGGNPSPAAGRFFFKSFAENEDLLVHTIHQKGSAMGWNRNKQKRGGVRFPAPVLNGRGHS
jgi:hypothetical protein